MLCIFICALLLGCTFKQISTKTALQASSLEVKSIAFNDGKTKQLPQIVISFNQDVAILGAVPSPDQIDAVSISHDLKPLCLWRFVTLDQLACELNGGTKYLTEYQVSVNKGFSGMAKELQKTTTASFTVPLPAPFSDHIFDFVGADDEFPSKIIARYSSKWDIPVAALNRSLQLKSPSGNYIALNVRVSTATGYGKDSLVITPRTEQMPIEEGIYHLVLPTGFSASADQVPLAEEITLTSFGYYNSKFEFLGAACVDDTQWNGWRDLDIANERIVDCPPERVAFKFSLPLAEQNANGWYGKDSNTSLSWLNGPDYVALITDSVRRIHYYTFSLSGDSQYQLALSKVKSITGQSVKNSIAVDFVTGPSTPEWRFDESQGTVTAVGSENYASVLRKNVEDLQQNITPVETPVQLLTLLNGKTTSIQTRLPAAPETMKTLRPQTLDFRQHLTSGKGLVFYQLRGRSVEHYRSTEVKDKNQQFVLQTADYNVAIWHQQDLLLQIHDWQARPLQNVSVELVCEGQPSPIELGKTDQGGVIWVTADKWHTLYGPVRGKTCWVWTSHGHQHAAIKVPTVTVEASNQVNVFAWTSQPIYQPGERIDIGIIGRERTVNGLIPMTNFQDVTFELRDVSDHIRVPLVISEPSAQGFAHGTYQLPDDVRGNYYAIYMNNKITGGGYNVGNVFVHEYTPPEFEQTITAPAQVWINGTVSAQISAKRMNDVPLTNAKINIHAHINREYKTPNTWPDDYVFNSWADFNGNHNGKEKLKSLNGVLDKQGEFIFTSEKLESTVPFGRLEIHSEVVSDTGEAFNAKSSSKYFSRQHYVGTKFDEETKLLSVIAINHKGNQLAALPVSIALYTPHPDAEQPDQQIGICEIEQLPGTCLIEGNHREVKLVITSGDQQYTWFRNLSLKNSDNEQETTKFKAPFELTTSSTHPSYKVGERIQLNLFSEQPGVASFILQGGAIQKVWRQKVVKGDNVVELSLDSSLIPYGRVYASMAVDDERANARVSKALMTHGNRLVSKAYDYQTHKFFTGSQRLFKSQLQINVAPMASPPKVKLNVGESKINKEANNELNHLTNNVVQAGTEVTLSIQSDSDGEAQVWLVNDGLLALWGTTEDAYDYHQKLYSSNGFEKALTFDALSEHLMLETRIEHWRTANYFRSPDFDVGASSASHNYTNQKSFAQSVWLDTVTLKANETKQLQVTLPQLIGRWKVLALTASNQTFAVDSIDIKTTQEVEYFLNSPSTVFDIDQSEVAVTAVNRSAEPITDTLTLRVNQTPVEAINVTLNGGEHRQLKYTLPALSEGEYHISLKSKRLAKFEARKPLTVNSGLRVNSHIWLVTSGDSNRVKVPDNAIYSSLSLGKLATDETAPNWRELLAYTRDYPHQCWEQTISRAVSYSFNPVSQTQWPEGQSILRSQLFEVDLYWWWREFSYFPASVGDPWLTAYTYLVYSWLVDSNVVLPLKQNEVTKRLQGLLEDKAVHNRREDRNNEVKSMALLALSSNQDIDLTQALEIRQKIGVETPRDTILQALALKQLGAEPSLYYDDLKAVMNLGYVDTHSNVFNQNSDKCFALLALDENDVEREGLMAQLLKQQSVQGHFGSTLANAVCTYAMRDRQAQPKEFADTPFTTNHSELSYRTDDNDSYWLKLSYQQAIPSLPATSAGLNVQRLHYVNRNHEWQLLDDSEPLKVGEVVKTSVVIRSPIQRQHVAITDDVAGGFEVINPAYNQLYPLHLDKYDYKNGRLEIRKGKVYWYLRTLNKGEKTFSYYSRVKHRGKYHMAPAKVEAMYRSDVFATSSSRRVEVGG